jgi:hypothetical protein
MVQKRKDLHGTSNHSSSSTAVPTVVVTEAMITHASEAGDLVSLTQWARQGVRVATAVPLICAARSGIVEVVRILVTKVGADVNDKRGDDGTTALFVAALNGHLDIVRCLVELGADVNCAEGTGETPLIIAASRGHVEVVRFLVDLGASVGVADILGETTFLASAHKGRYSTMQYLLEHAGANMEDVDNRGDTAWGLLNHHLQMQTDDEGDLAALISLLRVLVLRGDPPRALVALLSPEPASVVQEGARLQARLPAYLMRRRALLDAHCPLLLPPLRALVHTYMELTTTEELWGTGLGAAP